jgi:hypothetical protein
MSKGIHRLVRVTACNPMILQRSSVTVVMDLGLRSDPNLHRAQCGPFRVRMKHGKAVGGASKTSEKRNERIDL